MKVFHQQEIYLPAQLKEIPSLSSFQSKAIHKETISPMSCMFYPASYRKKPQTLYFLQVLEYYMQEEESKNYAAIHRRHCP